MAEDQLVLYPYMVMLVNLPVKRDEESKVWKCTLSNQDLTNDFTDFAPDLRQTVKIVYCKDGVRLRRDKAYAYAKFADYHDLLLFDQALKDRGRHRADYNRDYEIGMLRDCMYGWMATMRDFDHLGSVGITIRNQRTLTLSDIHRQEKKRDDQSKKELAEAQLQLANTKSKLTTLEKQINDQIRMNEEKRLEYEGAEAELARKRNERELELEQNQKELNRLDLEFNKQIACIEKKLQSREQFKNEREAILTKKLDQQRAQRKLKCEIEFFKQQSETEAHQRQDYLSSLEHSMKEGARMKEECKEMSDRMQKQNEELTKHKTMTLAQDLELVLTEQECIVCLGNFDPVLTQDLQNKEGISPEEFDRMNICGDYEEPKIWRNLFLPCLHAKLCGVCAQSVIDKAKKDTELDKKGRIHKPVCPICKTAIECFVPLRFATGNKRNVDSIAMP